MTAPLLLGEWVGLEGPLLILFLAMLGFLLSTSAYFWLIIVPNALDPWEAAQGLTIVERNNRAIDQILSRGFPSPWAYEIRVRDETGFEKQGIATVRREPFYGMTVESCSIRAIWDPPIASLE